jgi:hypothetical protein
MFNDRSSALESSSLPTENPLPAEAFQQTPMFQDDPSSVLRISSESSDNSVLLPFLGGQYANSQPSDDMNPQDVDTNHGNTIHIQPGTTDDAEADEYVIEAIIDHYIDHATRYYLVKWEGYEDSHDWLQEKDLADAQELLHEYNKKIREKERNDYSGEYQPSYSRR